MRHIIISLSLLVLTRSAMATDIQTAVESMDAQIERAIRLFISTTDTMIRLAESRGQQAQADAIRTERDAAVAARRSATGSAHTEVDSGLPAGPSPSNEPEPIVVDARLLSRLFKARASVNRDGVVHLMYDFRRPDQAQDFEFRIQDARIERGTLVLGAQEVMRHAAQWTGPVTVRTEIAFGGWDGQYMSLGNARVSGSNYNAWSVRLGDQRALFHRRYQLTGDITDYRQLQLILDDHRSLLTYGMFENAPVSVATPATPIKRASLSVFGGSAGAAMRGLFIQGTLDQDWLREQLVGQD